MMHYRWIQGAYRGIPEELIPRTKSECSGLIQRIASLAFAERCRRFQREYTASIERNVELIADFYSDQEWPFGYTVDDRVDGVFDILSMFNSFGAWDIREGMTRLGAGIEQTLIRIEPPVVFARLHGRYLTTLDAEDIDRYGLRRYAEKYGADPNHKSIWTELHEANREGAEQV